MILEFYMFDVINIVIPGLSVVAEAALRHLAAAHVLHVEERPQAGQRLALGPVGARADVGQAPEMKCLGSTVRFYSFKV